jgi:hypothetical protein
VHICLKVLGYGSCRWRWKISYLKLISKFPSNLWKKGQFLLDGDEMGGEGRGGEGEGEGKIIEMY